MYSEEQKVLHPTHKNRGVTVVSGTAVYKKNERRRANDVCTQQYSLVPASPRCPYSSIL